MPLHDDWKPLYESFMETYCDGAGEDSSPKGGPCRKGEQVFYAYCAEHGIDYTKPKPGASEALRWVGGLLPEEREGRYFVRGRAIHPCKTYHPGEWPEVRVYLEEELEASAPTLSGKPLTLDHAIELGPPNRVLKAAWEDGAVEYVAEVSKDIYDLVKGGEIQHVSVEYDWRLLEKLDGIAPRGLQLTGLSLLKGMRPGDPEAFIEVWEGVVRKLKEMKRMSQDNNAEGLESGGDGASKGELEVRSRRVRDLADEKDALRSDLSLGEAVVEPGPPRVPPGYVKAEEILAILPKDVPLRWGAGPHELVRRIRAKCHRSS